MPNPGRAWHSETSDSLCLVPRTLPAHNVNRESHQIVASPANLCCVQCQENYAGTDK
jgi:hypothetical protein